MCLSEIIGYTASRYRRISQQTQQPFPRAAATITQQKLTGKGPGKQPARDVHWAFYFPTDGLPLLNFQLLDSTIGGLYHGINSSLCWKQLTFQLLSRAWSFLSAVLLSLLSPCQSEEARPSQDRGSVWSRGSVYQYNVHYTWMLCNLL